MLQVFLLPLTADHSTISIGAFPFNLIPRLSVLRHGNEFGWRLIWEVHTGGRGLGGDHECIVLSCMGEEMMEV